MSKYNTNRKPAKKLVTINLDLEISEEQQVRDLIKQGHDLLSTLEGIKANRLEKVESEIAATKKSIEDLK